MSVSAVAMSSGRVIFRFVAEASTMRTSAPRRSTIEASSVGAGPPAREYATRALKESTGKDLGCLRIPQGFALRSFLDQAAIPDPFHRVDRRDPGHRPDPGAASRTQASIAFGGGNGRAPS